MTELIIALSIFTILLATTMGFYQQQGRAFTAGNERMGLMQNLRYGIAALEQDLRTVGVGVPAKQPFLVYADGHTIAFNADYATRIANDFFAVYYDAQLPETAVSAPRPAQAFTIPGTGVTYPDSAYFVGSGNSPAETIIFFFALDTSTPRIDDYGLYRQANGEPADLIARNLVRTSQPFFTFFTTAPAGLSASPVAPIASSKLPLHHSVPIHGALGDTGAVARVDSVRAVRVSFAATNGYTDHRETRREIARLIRLPNAGLDTPRSCGNKPILGVGLFAVGVKPTQTTAGHIRLEWYPATDETSGEQDVIRYVIWRRRPAESFGDPLASVSPGLTQYVYRDFTAVKENKYRYALAAQDCTPQYSTMSATDDKEWTQ